MKATLRVGILGTGFAGRSHAAAFARLPNVAITDVWNRTRVHAEALAATLYQQCIRVHKHWEDLVEGADVDVISIATTPVLRREAFAIALERGIHILVEKPIALDLSDAKAMAEQAQTARSVTATCFNWRYLPGCLAARRALQEGQIGQIHSISLEYRLPSMGSSPALLTLAPWRSRPELGGGMLLSKAGHEFDRVRFLTGCEFKQITGCLGPLATRSAPGGDR